jgi:hypothetical protein
METRGRLVYANQTVVDQQDFFQSDGYTRVTGLLVGNLTMKLFSNNVLQPWSFVTGANLTDIQILSGSVYWWEIPGSPGFYSVRFRPNAVGYWRLVLSYPAGMLTEAHDYDVVPVPPPVAQGLTSSFVRPESAHGHEYGHEHGHWPGRR